MCDVRQWTKFTWTESNTFSFNTFKGVDTVNIFSPFQIKCPQQQKQNWMINSGEQYIYIKSSPNKNYILPEPEPVGRDIVVTREYTFIRVRVRVRVLNLLFCLIYFGVLIYPFISMCCIQSDPKFGGRNHDIIDCVCSNSQTLRYTLFPPRSNLHVLPKHAHTHETLCFESESRINICSLFNVWFSVST